MALTAALISASTPIDATLNQFQAYGTITPSGTYPTNGDTMDLSQLGIPGNAVPFVEIFEYTPASGKPASGFHFVFLPGTTQANGVMEIFDGANQVTTQTYAALDLPADFVLMFRMWVPSFL